MATVEVDQETRDITVIIGEDSGVQSVTGAGVVNTDPKNPVISAPSKADIGLGNVDNTSDEAKPVSIAQAAALTAKADKTALTSHTAATNNPHGVSAAQVGLGNVNNTSDANKPVSTAQAAALALKADKTELFGGAYSDLSGAPVNMPQAEAEAGNATTTRTISAATLKNAIAALAPTPAAGIASVTGALVDNSDPSNPVVLTPDKEDVGLSNVDNTSDDDKPVSTAQAAALALKADKTELPTWTTISGKPAVIASGATQSAARAAIGAGTSNLALGTTASTAMAGNTSIPIIPTVMPQAEAEAGTDTTQRTITAQRLNQAIQALAPTGGGAVPAPMTQAEAEAGTEPSERVISPLILKAAIDFHSDSGGGLTTRVEVTGDKTLTQADGNTLQYATAAATISVLTNSTVPTLGGTRVDYFQVGAGAITFSKGPGVDIVSENGVMATSGPGKAATLIKLFANTWALII